jgi:hypothetical protein
MDATQLVVDDGIRLGGSRKRGCCALLYVASSDVIEGRLD